MGENQRVSGRHLSSIASVAASRNKRQPAAEQRAIIARRKRKILIVEDELWSVLDMEWVARKLGHDVVGTVATAVEALELAERLRPDLILMDIRLADNGSGIDAAITVKEQFDIPSIFVSAHGDLATRIRAADAQPANFIEKPFTPEALASAIEKALQPPATPPRHS